MKTYLLSWNPDRWTWTTLLSDANDVKRGKGVQDNWSTKSHQIQPGDRLFLLRQAKEPRGIMASATAISAVWEDRHYSPELGRQGKRCWYVGLEWESLLVPGEDEILPRQLLNRHEFAGVTWDIRSSGVAIPEDVAARLKRAWQGHLASLAYPVIHPVSEQTSGSEDYYQNWYGGVGTTKVSATPPKRAKRGQARTASVLPPRDVKQGAEALRKARHECEFNKTHRTFIKSNNRPFMEKHHLIPMEKYFDFERSIDHWKNIFSLCPVCHRQIHHGKPADKKRMVEQLYNSRQKVYDRTYRVTCAEVVGYYT